MAVGFPTKVNFATGDVLSAQNMNDLSGTVNLLESAAESAAGVNKIINGDFGVWQRGATFDITLSTYNADRFAIGTSGNTGTVTQQTFTPGTAPVSGYEGQFFARANITGVAGASNFTQFLQRIEDVRTFAGQTVTISYWAKADAAKSVSLELAQSFGSGGSTTVNTFIVKQALTTSWARYTTTFAVPSVTGKTIGTSSYADFRFWLSAGSTFDARTSSLGTQSIIFDVWGVQVEAGSTASDFKTATGTKQGELAACQRYYYRQTSASNYTYFGGGFAASTTQAKWMAKLPTTMRTSPSFSITNATNLNIGAVASQAVTSITLDQANPDSVGLFANCTAGLVAGQSILIIGNNSSAPFIEYSSEL